MALLSRLSTKQEDTTTQKDEVVTPVGQLAVDVYETDNEVVILAPIAGVSIEGIDISVEGDMLTISGERVSQHNAPEDAYFTQECYWGKFSRSIILPTAVDTEHIKASFKDGILSVRVAKNSAVVRRSIHIELE